MNERTVTVTGGSPRDSAPPSSSCQPDLIAEGLLSTAAAARYLNKQTEDPREGRHSPLSVWRAMTKGNLAAGGVRVHLEHVRLGRSLYTSRAALTRYAGRLASTAGEQVPGTESEPQRQLANLGFYPSSRRKPGNA